MSSIDWQPYIVIDPAVCFGMATVRGTRITVADVLDWLAEGRTVEDIVTEVPRLTRESIRACLAFAADRDE